MVIILLAGSLGGEISHNTRLVGGLLCVGLVLSHKALIGACGAIGKGNRGVASRELAGVFHRGVWLGDIFLGGPRRLRHKLLLGSLLGGA